MTTSPLGDGLSVAQVLDWYESTGLLLFSPTALKERQRVWKLFREAYGGRLVEECKPVLLLNFIAAQKGCKSNWTRRRLKATINRPFNAAAEAGLILRNPFSGVKIPEGMGGRDWTSAEYRAILRNSPAFFRRYVVFLRFSGARPGEARTLKWGEVLEEARAIVQKEHKTVRATRQPRRIYFNSILVKLLSWLRRHKTSDLWVFTNSFGKPWTIKAVTKRLDAIRKRVGLPPDVKMHGGRHTFATNAILNDVNLAKLAELLGHRSAKTTERYLHLATKKGHLNAAMEQAIGRYPSPED